MNRKSVFGIIVFSIPVMWYLISILVRPYEYEFYYYTSPDKKHFITRIEHKPLIWVHATFFTRGHYTDLSNPESFIQPIYSGRDGGFIVLLHWEKSNCIIYAPHGKFETSQLDSSFQLKITNPYLDKKWNGMNADTLDGNNLFLTEYKFN